MFDEAAEIAKLEGPCPISVETAGLVMRCTLTAQHRGPCINVRGEAITLAEIHPLARAEVMKDRRGYYFR